MISGRRRYSSGTIAIAIGLLATRVIPKTLYETLARLIPVPNIPEEALILGVAAVIAGLVFLTIVGVGLLWASRQGAASASSDTPTDDGK